VLVIILGVVNHDHHLHVHDFEKIVIM